MTNKSIAKVLKSIANIPNLVTYLCRYRWCIPVL